jgi:hypothetical protein
MEQRVNTRFYCKLSKTPTENYEMSQTACGDEALSRSSASDWFKRSKDGREDLQDDPRSGRPTASRNGREVVTRERRWALGMMADEVNSSEETILQKRRMCAKFVPHRLTDQQKQRRLASHQGYIQTWQDKRSFLHFVFSFLK